MDRAKLAIENRATYFAVLLIAVGGLFSFFGLGQLEDPELTVKPVGTIGDRPPFLGTE